MPVTKYEFPADRLFITPQYLRLRYGSFDPNVFTRWQRRGWVEKLGKGVYRNTRKRAPYLEGEFVTSAQLVQPSYVSLHVALHFWGLIPEHVVQITCLTTSKPCRIELPPERYRYRHIDPKMFFGFRWAEWHGGRYLLAHPEKALLDMAYLEPDFSDPDWVYEMRFDPWELEELDWERMDRYLRIIDSPVVNERIDILRTVTAL